LVVDILLGQVTVLRPRSPAGCAYGWPRRRN